MRSIHKYLIANCQTSCRQIEADLPNRIGLASRDQFKEENSKAYLAVIDCNSLEGPTCADDQHSDTSSKRPRTTHPNSTGRIWQTEHYSP